MLLLQCLDTPSLAMKVKKKKQSYHTLDLCRLGVHRATALEVRQEHYRGREETNKKHGLRVEPQLHLPESARGWESRAAEHRD